MFQESKKRTHTPSKAKKTPKKGSAKKRGRAALRQLNQSPLPAADKERLLESLQLSPLKVPQRLPEPTISLGNERMQLVTCEWSGSAASTPTLTPVDRSYVMTISVEADDGGEAEINLSWSSADLWENRKRTLTQSDDDDEPREKRPRREEAICKRFLS